MFLPNCWLQLHNTELLVSKIRTVWNKNGQMRQLTQAMYRLWFTSPRISTIDAQDCG